MIAADRDQYSKCQNISNFLVHALNSVLAITDMWIMAIPIRVTSMIYPVSYAILYSFFS
jgi:hypothetical protein